LKKIFTNLLIIIIFQAGIYLYLDQVLLVPAVKFSQKLVTETPKLKVDPQKVSTDQKYYVKLDTISVKFYTADNKLAKEVPLQAWESVTYFSWVPDTDLALLGISSNTSQGTSVTLKPVNLETDSHPVEPKISGLSRGARIEDVAFSAQVNVTYMLIKGKYTTAVYRTDANNHLRRVNIASTVRRIASLQSQDMLIYDSIEHNAVYALSGKGTRVQVSPVGGKYALIGTDKYENIYMGKLSGAGVVTTIWKGTMKGDFTEFKLLNYPYPVASVTIDYDGKLRLA
jgi:hypothetical protein